MSQISSPHGDVLHRHEDAPKDKVVQIRLNRSTFMSGILLLFAIVVTVQFFQIKGLRAQVTNSGSAQQPSVSAPASQQPAAQPAQSSGALQNLPSQVGGC